MLSILAAILLSLPATWIIWSVARLHTNYTAALKTGCPIIVRPIDPMNPLWIAISRRIIDRLRQLPRPFRQLVPSSFLRFCYHGWEYRERYAVFAERGADAVMVVSPGQNWLSVCGPEAVLDMMQRRNDFPRPLETLAMLDLFGKSVATVDGADWQRMRRITNVPFDEQSNGVVWGEAVRQAGEMLEVWKAAEGPMTTVEEDAKTFTFNVLSKAVFGRGYPFRPTAPQGAGGRDGEDANGKSSKQSLSTILHNIVLLLVFGADVLRLRCMPRRWRGIGRAFYNFRNYMQDIVTEQRHAIRDGGKEEKNFVSSLLKASDQAGSDRKNNSSVGGLTEQEILGNIFVLNFAGHDTTALTLTFCFILLSANPDVQDWLSEEIVHVFGGSEAASWDYREAFPRLKRCKAVLLETLRLHDPAFGVTKSTGSHSRSLTVGKRTYIVGKDTMITVNLSALHTHPQYWGADALEWNPYRWITSSDDANSAPDSPVFAREEIMTPARGSYMPWSEGQRICPGKKFTQVEMVALFAVLFHGHRVEPARKHGESPESARQRMLDVVQDAGMVLLLQVLHPERAGLRWVERTP